MTQGELETKSAKSAVSGAPAVARAIAVLRLLSKSDEPLGVNAIAKSLDLIPSTCLHILRALVAETLVAFNPVTKLYTMDAGILPLAQRHLRLDDFSQRVLPHLDEISAKFSVTAVGVRAIGLRHIVVVNMSRNQGLLNLHVEVGSHFPTLISATGRCYAAFGPHQPQDLRGDFEELEWDNPPTFDDWLEEVDAVRTDGFSVDASQYIRGVSIIAAPVFGRDGIMSHGLAAFGLGAQLEDGKAEELGRMMKEAGIALSRNGQGQSENPL